MALGRFGAALGGRIARSVWRRLPEKDKQSIKDGLARRKRLLYGLGWMSICGGGYYYYSHVEYMPLTDRSRYMLYTRSDVQQVLTKWGEDSGKDYIRMFVDPEKILPPTDPHYRLLQRVVVNILFSNKWCKELNSVESWRIIVVEDDDVVNAICLPTGDIVVFTGMINKCDNDDELGLIMSHEIAHVALNHGAEMLSRKGLLSFMSMFVIATVWFLIPSDFLSFLTHKMFNSSVEILVENPYSRKLELEADKIGLMFASNACYNPNKAIQIWNNLPEGVKYISTHPDNKKRFKLLSSLLPTAINLYNTNNCSTHVNKFLTARTD